MIPARAWCSCLLLSHYRHLCFRGGGALVTKPRYLLLYQINFKNVLARFLWSCNRERQLYFFAWFHIPGDPKPVVHFRQEFPVFVTPLIANRNIEFVIAAIVCFTSACQPEHVTRVANLHQYSFLLPNA